MGGRVTSANHEVDEARCPVRSAHPSDADKSLRERAPLDKHSECDQSVGSLCSPGPQPGVAVDGETPPKDRLAETTVRSESTASPPRNTPRPVQALKTVSPAIVPLEANNGLQDFRSVHEIRAEEASVVHEERHFNWRNIALGLLAVIAVAQGGLMAYWFFSNRAPALPATGSVAVTSEPSGSPVLVDGVARGVTPFTLSLQPGSHRVEVGAGTQARSQAVNVTRGGVASMHVELRPSPESAAFAPGTGGLQITTDPAGARVSIDGEPRGTAPLSALDLKAGEHVVTVRGARDSVNRTVAVREGTTTALIVSMNGEGAFASGWLAVSSGVPM